MQIAQLVQYIVYGVTVGGIYTLIALGFNIIYNATEVINFAQGEFLMLGAMVMVFLESSAKLPTALAFLLSMIIVTAIGVVFERAAINRVKNPSVITLIIITVGASIFIRGLSLIIWGDSPIRVEPFSKGEPVFILGASIMQQRFWVLGVVTVAVALVQLFYKYTYLGKAMRATAINRQAARLMGIDVRLMVMFSFALSAALGACAGMVISPITFASYDMGALLGLKGFCAAVLGGLGNSVGAILGGLIIGIVENLAVGFAPSGYSGYRDAIAFIILLIILFVKPSGLLGVTKKAL